MDLPGDIEIDFSDLLLGDLEDLEEMIGAEGLDAVMSGKPPRPKAMVALAFVALRKAHPDITMDDVRKVRLSAIKGPGPTKPSSAKS